MKICFHGDYFKSYLPTNPGIFCIFLPNFWGWLHVLEILDTALLLGYTMVDHSD